MNIQPIKILEPQSKIGFSITLFVRLLVLIPIFCVSILLIINGSKGIGQGIVIEYWTVIFGIFAFCFTGYHLVNYFFLNPRKMKELQYLLFGDKLVIYNQKKQQELHSISYDHFPEFSFHENLNDFGYIVIGPEVPLIDRKSPHSLKWGVSMEDAEIMLENLPDVRKEYEFLKGLIEAYNKKTEE